MLYSAAPDRHTRQAGATQLPDLAKFAEPSLCGASTTPNGTCPGWAAAVGSVSRRLPGRTLVGKMRRFRPFVGPRWSGKVRPISDLRRDEHIDGGVPATASKYRCRVQSGTSTLCRQWGTL